MEANPFNIPEGYRVVELHPEGIYRFFLQGRVGIVVDGRLRKYEGIVLWCPKCCQASPFHLYREQHICFGEKERD